jgi:hypothetical protein
MTPKEAGQRIAAIAAGMGWSLATLLDSDGDTVAAVLGEREAVLAIAEMVGVPAEQKVHLSVVKNKD